jgi:hypothetical protein
VLILFLAQADPDLVPVVVIKVAQDFWHRGRRNVMEEVQHHHPINALDEPVIENVALDKSERGSRGPAAPTIAGPLRYVAR